MTNVTCGRRWVKPPPSRLAHVVTARLVDKRSFAWKRNHHPKLTVSFVRGNWPQGITCTRAQSGTGRRPVSSPFTSWALNVFASALWPVIEPCNASTFRQPKRSSGPAEWAKGTGARGVAQAPFDLELPSYFAVFKSRAFALLAIPATREALTLGTPNSSRRCDSRTDRGGRRVATAPGPSAPKIPCRSRRSANRGGQSPGYRHHATFYRYGFVDQSPLRSDQCRQAQDRRRRSIHPVTTRRPIPKCILRARRRRARQSLRREPGAGRKPEYPYVRISGESVTAAPPSQ